MFLKHALTHVVKKGIEVVHVPCCGQFALVKTAIEAGINKKNIYASEISLFSNLLGYYYTDKEIEKIGFSLKLDEDKYEYENLKETEKKIALLMYIMKIEQLREDVYYENQYIKELKSNKGLYLREITELLKRNKEYYSGINYAHDDLRLVIERKYDEKELLLVNPPAFAKGYTKMFNFENRIEYNPNVEEWDFKKEYDNSFEVCEKNNTNAIFYKYKSAGKHDPKAIFARKYTDQRSDFWIATKKEYFEDMVGYREVVQKKERSVRFFNLKIFNENDKVTENSIVTLKLVDKEIAGYYRDLWAHKLGYTNSESAHLIIIDNKIAGIVGWHSYSSELRGLKSEYIFEVFCFNPITKYKRFNRLLMMFLLSKETKKELYKTIFKTNRIFHLRGIKTTCLSKYRKVKLNNGLLYIQKREKLKNGLYKILYTADFYEDSYRDCIKRFLKEENEKGN
jgi:hypothetical protein